MTEFADNIRRIAKGTRQKGALGRYQEREPVLGGTVTLVTNSYQVGGDTPSSGGVNSPTQQDETGNDQSATDPNNPDSFYKGGGSSTDYAQETGKYDMEDIIDGKDGPQTASEEDGSTPSDYDSAINSLEGATDCNTGQCINFHTDGNFPAPEGWEDADTPPPIENNFIAGKKWIYSTEEGGEYPTAYQAAQAYIAQIESETYENHAFGGGFTELNFASSPPSANYTLTYTQISNGEYIEGTGTVFALSCAPDAETDPACVTEDPEETSDQNWPQDGCYDLALQDGGFSTHERDSEAPQGAGGSKVDFCFGDGRTGSAEATANGGFMVYETSGGAPTGTAKVYDADGKFHAAGNATDSFMNQYRPQ